MTAPLSTDDLVRLRECPFCGEPVEMHDYTKKPALAWVMIHRCKIIGPIKLDSFSGDELREKWNTRAPDPELIRLRGEVEAMRATTLQEAADICKRVRMTHAENNDQAVGALDCALAILGAIPAAPTTGESHE